MSGGAPQAFREGPTGGLREEVRPHDAEAVGRLVEATGVFSREECALAVSLVCEALERGAASGYHFLFAPSDERLLGYTCYGPIPATRESFDLYWIAVDPAHHGRGLGRRLLAETEARVVALGGRRVYVDTSGRGAYAPARAFYERSGYRAEAILADFYAPGDDKVIYARQLPAGGAG